MQKEIRHYKVIQEIGKGGMGCVYKALDPRAQRTVAIKVLPVNLVDRSSVERFNRECQAMSRFKHPNLVEFYEYGMHHGEHFYVMEHIEGESLRSMIKRRGQLPVKEALRIASEVAQAVSAIHAEGMIHRDIKPANVMITSSGHAKLMDFGLIKMPGVTHVTASGSSVGTAEYMSPEQVSGDEIDSRSDIYSLGISLYEMLAGHPPFTGDSLQAVLMKHKYEPARALSAVNPAVPKSLEGIVHKALAKDLANRYQRVNEFVHDLQQMIGQSPAGESGPISSTRIVRSSNQQSSRKDPSPTPVLPVALGILAAVLVAAFLLRGFFFPGTATNQNGPSTAGAPIAGSVSDRDRMMQAEEYYHNGLLYQKDNLLGQAAREYQRAIELRPGYGMYYAGLAGIYEKQESTGQAVEVWKRLLKADPDGEYAAVARKKIKQLRNR